jgi:hypothetical protein
VSGRSVFMAGRAPRRRSAHGMLRGREGCGRAGGGLHMSASVRIQERMRTCRRRRAPAHMLQVVEGEGRCALVRVHSSRCCWAPLQRQLSLCAHASSCCCTPSGSCCCATLQRQSLLPTLRVSSASRAPGSPARVPRSTCHFPAILRLTPPPLPPHRLALAALALSPQLPAFRLLVLYLSISLLWPSSATPASFRTAAPPTLPPTAHAARRPGRPVP